MAANKHHDSQPETDVLPVKGPPIRIAESGVAAVDLCECGCGTLHLHIGALTLRVSEETLRELLITLEQAVAAQPAHKSDRHPELLLASTNRQSPGAA